MHLKQKEVKHWWRSTFTKGRNDKLPANTVNQAKYKKKTHLQDIPSINLHKGRENDCCAQGIFLDIFSRRVVRRIKTAVESAL